MNEILTIILKDTYSLSQLKHRLRILKTSLLKAFFGSKEEISFSPDELSWLKSLPDNFYQKFSKDNIYQIFTEFEQEISKLQTLTIHLTFEPDESTLAQIGTYVRHHFEATIPLDIKFDPSLIAGAALVWKGVYKDYSLKARLDAKKTEMLQEFKRFLR
ncbi:F0F1 ATP synthase subunit delta [Candidatus Daviesbacteria bacterium]|nr:F0F1 ATP synthase subunit delta [Candidatus Daviesbacteria bacterium]